MRYVGDQGFILSYFGSVARDFVSERTDREQGIDGGRFQPYKRRFRYEQVDGKWRPERDPATGQWQLARTGKEAVTLRSHHRIPEGKRMRDNLIVAPKVIRSTTRSVLVTVRGKRDGVDHYLRAATVSGMMSGPGGRRVPARKWIGIKDGDWSRIIARARLDGALAFIKHERRRIVEARIQQAIRRQQRTRKAIERAAKRAERAAKTRHEQEIVAVESLNMSAREAWKAKHRAKRIKRKKQRGARKRAAQKR